MSTNDRDEVVPARMRTMDLPERSAISKNLQPRSSKSPRPAAPRSLLGTSCPRDAGTEGGRAFRRTLLGADEFQKSSSNLLYFPLHVVLESGSPSVFARVDVSCERWPVFKVYEQSLHTSSSETLELTSGQATGEGGTTAHGERRYGAGRLTDSFPKSCRPGVSSSPHSSGTGCNAPPPGGRSCRRGPGGGSRTAFPARALGLRRPRALSRVLLLRQPPPPALLRAQATSSAPRHFLFHLSLGGCRPIFVHPHRAQVSLSSRPRGDRAAAVACGPRVPSP